MPVKKIQLVELNFDKFLDLNVSVILHLMLLTRLNEYIFGGWREDRGADRAEGFGDFEAEHLGGCGNKDLKGG